MIILGIESSCDDTGVALYGDNGLIGHVLHSQIQTHKNYGGVVPELASRDHIKKLYKIVSFLTKKHNIGLSNLDGIAYTKGPGLVGGLLVGASFAKSLGYSLNIPTLGVHHLEGHILSSFINNLDEIDNFFPNLTLLVSGGHTMLINAHSIGNYEIIGQTLDDAVGEAFDKTAKAMGLVYPGGPIISKLSEHVNLDTLNEYKLPIPMVKDKSLNFSFSGLKTSANKLIKEKMPLNNLKQANISFSLQKSIVSSINQRIKRAILMTKNKRLLVVGGVSANKQLRSELKNLGYEMGIDVIYPNLEFCTDNGAMIACTGYLKIRKNFDHNLAITVKPRWKLGEQA